MEGQYQARMSQKPRHRNVLKMPSSPSRQTTTTHLPKFTSSATAWGPTWLERQGAGLQAWAGSQVRPKGQGPMFCPQQPYYMLQDCSPARNWTKGDGPLGLGRGERVSRAQFRKPPRSPSVWQRGGSFIPLFPFASSASVPASSLWMRVFWQCGCSAGLGAQENAE